MPVVSVRRLVRIGSGLVQMTAEVIAVSEETSERFQPLQERGQRAVFCGLTSIIWLHRKIQDAFRWWPVPVPT